MTVPNHYKYIIDQNGCWIWQGAIMSNGYGVYVSEGISQTAHRFMYRYWIGEIADGLYLDHLCKNKRCVNPKHLEPVTQKENVKRAHKSTHCQNCSCSAVLYEKGESIKPIFMDWESWFWSNKVINKNDCWLWLGNRINNKYGVVYDWEKRNTGSITTHRMAYRLVIDDLIPGRQINHICSNSICYNPNHLEQITASQNMQYIWKREHCGGCFDKSHK